MRGISRQILARDAAAQLKQAACRGSAALWTRHERAHEQAQTRDEADQVALGALVLCDACPVVSLCQEWASIEAYTGLAAGAAWLNGRRREIPRPSEVQLAS